MRNKQKVRMRATIFIARNFVLMKLAIVTMIINY